MKSKDFLDSRRNQAAVCRRCRPPNGCTIGPIVVLCAAQVPWCFELHEHQTKQVRHVLCFSELYHLVISKFCQSQYPSGVAPRTLGGLASWHGFCLNTFSTSMLLLWFHLIVGIQEKDVHIEAFVWKIHLSSRGSTCSKYIIHHKRSMFFRLLADERHAASSTGQGGATFTFAKRQGLPSKLTWNLKTNRFHR